MSKGTQVVIKFGPLKGRRGEIASIEGGVYTVRHSGGSTTFRARDLVAV